MCGINLLATSGSRTDLVARMNAAIAHRGPDERGVFASGAFTLGNVRLAIRDVPNGHQPMTDPDSGVAISFNGEVWNDGELRAELRHLGHTFRTACDTEVVLRGFLEWGTDVFAKLHADFALAIVDGRRKRTYLARDRMGIKPLYLYADAGLIAAASEMKAILEAVPMGPASHRPVDPVDVDALYRHGVATEIDGIEFVLPGECVEIAWPNGRPTVKHSFYHRWDYSPHGDDEESATHILAALIEDAVRRQVVSDRPVAVALSGGVDSSIVAGVASKYVDLMCYSIGATDVTEVENARAVAEDLRRRGHRILGFKEVRVDEPAIRAVLDDGVRHLESSYPMQADMAAVTLVLAKAIADDGYKVLLCGEGADEVFLGYHSYFLRRQREGKLHEAMVEQVENLHRYNNVRVDKSFMAHGVEPRVPFQHAPLVAYALGIGSEMKIGNPDPSNGRPNVQKYILRRAAQLLRGLDGKPLLAEEVVWRRKEYYAKGMGLPDLIARSIGLATEGMSDAAAAVVRQREYIERFERLLLTDRAARSDAA